MPAEDIRHPEKQPIVFERRLENISKTKKDTKEVGTELHPRKGVLKREKFPNTRKYAHCQGCGKPWKHSGQNNREEK